MIPAMTPPLKGAASLLIAALVTCDPALTRLFTPAHPQWGAYEVCTDPRPVDVVVSSPPLSATARDADAMHYSGIEEMEPLDAFGRAGTYDRGRLVRLYGGQHVRIARGWRRQGGRFEAVTLISPYPDLSLSRLETGTMVIRWHMRR
jgi:hypothetical protein